MEDNNTQSKNKKAKRSKELLEVSYIETYESFVSPIDDEAVINSGSKEQSLRYKRDLVALVNFIMEDVNSKASNDILKYSKVYGNSALSDHKWNMLFAWGSVKKNPVIHCQFILNSIEMFQDFTIQTSGHFEFSVSLAMHWTEKVRSPVTVAEFDQLIWTAQLCMTCLQDFFSLEFDKRESESMKSKGFKSLPIQLILKSNHLFDTEFISPLSTSMPSQYIQSSKKIMKLFYQSIGFNYRRESHFKDWAFEVCACEDER